MERDFYCGMLSCDLALFRVKDGSGALLWAAFFGQAIKSGNVPIAIGKPDP
jgi:hypothetical protein